MASLELALQFLCHFKTIHSRHEYIADNQVGIIRARLFISGDTIFRHFHFKIDAYFLFQQLADVVVVLNNQYFSFVQRVDGRFRKRG